MSQSDQKTATAASATKEAERKNEGNAMARMLGYLCDQAMTANTSFFRLFLSFVSTGIEYSKKSTSPVSNNEEQEALGKTPKNKWQATR